MVSSVFLLQLGHRGESAHLMQWRCSFSPIWLVHSCMMMDDCLHESGLMSCSHFFKGVDLSIFPMCWYRGEAFQQRAQSLWSLALDSWRSAETLNRRGFLKNVSRSRGLLEFPFTASLAYSSAFSFSLKSLWSGIHWILRLNTPLDLATISLPWSWALLNSSLHWSRSWHCCKCSTAVWIWSTR